MQPEFKPNIYPIMYWALAFGAAAGVSLFIVFLLSRFITQVWFPVFLVGMVWGGYRNYQKQKTAWRTQSGVPAQPQSPMQEFKEAVSDVVDASRTMMAEQRMEDVARAQAEADEAVSQEEEVPTQNQPPQTPI